jgi:hypothetical protein
MLDAAMLIGTCDLSADCLQIGRDPPHISRMSTYIDAHSSPSLTPLPVLGLLAALAILGRVPFAAVDSQRLDDRDKCGAFILDVSVLDGCDRLR